MAFACEFVTLVVVQPPRLFGTRHAAVGPVPKDESPPRAHRRATLKLRLHMVHLLGVDVGAPANLVRSLDLREVGSEGILVVVPVVRRVRLFGAEGGIAADVESWPAALEPFGSICSGQAQLLQTVGSRPMPGCSTFVFWRVQPPERVHQQRRREDVVRADTDAVVVTPRLAGVARRRRAARP